MTEILFVDDEPQILSALRRVFRDVDGWTCHFAQSPKEALEILARRSMTVLVTDHRMPQMTGAEFLARVKEKRPNMIRIMLTGQANIEAVGEAINKGEIFRFVSKPWDDDELRRIVTDAVRYHDECLKTRNVSLSAQHQSAKLKGINVALEDTVKTRTLQLSDALLTAQALTKSLEESLFMCGRAFFSIVELARPDLGCHSRRVAEHSIAVGAMLQMNKKELMELEIAALLHDIGKVGLPAFMLERSPADFSREEYELYKLHVAAGTEALASLRGYENISAIINQHHERFNGQGFPCGMKGSEVSERSYIVGIMDEYDHVINRPQGDEKFNYQYTFQRLADTVDSDFPSKIVQVALDHIETYHQSKHAENEIRVGILDLVPNMELTRDIYSMSGAMLLATNTRLTQSSIKRIRSIARIDPIVGEIYIKSNKTSNESQPVPAI